MIVRNCKVMWASVQKPNTTYTPRWEVCMYPDEAGIQQMNDAGLNMKEDKKTQELYYRATCNVARKDGTPNEPPGVVDAALEPFTKLIGNGSICNIKLYVREVDAFGKKMMKGYLSKVQVIKHVPYDDGEDFDVVETGEEF